MNTRCMLYARAAAFVIIIMALFVPTAGQAQVANCNNCDHFTFTVRADVACPITICYAVSPASRPLCVIVNPGSSINIPCPVYQAWVNTCSGPHYIVPAAADARCSQILKFSAGCCGQICNVPSLDLCTRLEVRPAPCDNDSCP